MEVGTPDHLKGKRLVAGTRNESLYNRRRTSTKGGGATITGGRRRRRGGPKRLNKKFRGKGAVIKREQWVRDDGEKFGVMVGVIKWEG